MRRLVIIFLAWVAVAPAMAQADKTEGMVLRPPSEMIIPSKGQLQEYVLSLMAEGGDLDFFTPIEGKENDGIQVKQGVFSTNLGIALCKWGRECYEIGVNTEQDCYEIFAVYRGRALNQRETEYIRTGFYKALEE